jgi:tetratricopeptide (TPR) repeat protein
MHRSLAFALFALSVSSITAAQFQPVNRVQLVVNVFIGSTRNPAPPNLTVQLLDRMHALEKEGHTDTSGRVEFQTKTTKTETTKQLRVFGAGIEDHVEDVEIESIEYRKMVNIIVKAKPGIAASAAIPSGTGAVSATMLNVPEKAEKEFKKGSEALKKKEWEEAKKGFNSAIGIYPEYDAAYNGLGVALMGTGDSKAARPAFEKAISLNDHFAEAYRNLARISLSEKKFEETDNLLTRSLSSDPLNSWALAYAAYAELQLRRFNDAIAHARKAHEGEHKDLASVHIVAALALEATDQKAEAAEQYRLYLREDPSGRDAARAKAKLAVLEGAPER